MYVQIYNEVSQKGHVSKDERGNRSRAIFLSIRISPEMTSRFFSSWCFLLAWIPEAFPARRGHEQNRDPNVGGWGEASISGTRIDNQSSYLYELCKIT